mmetsp:Transcript_21305/g.28347  ORF Transcript_21305/g.28347 Transcript_21305/m.28347 type:complete len:140 (+) Transcript_21305:286-705(+)
MLHPIENQKSFSRMSDLFLIVTPSSLNVLTHTHTHRPKALLLHLKRFIVDFSPCYTNVSYRKNRSAVEFPQALSLYNSSHSSPSSAGKAVVVPMEEENVNGVLGEFLARDVIIPSMPSMASTTENDTQGDDEDDDNHIY